MSLDTQPEQSKHIPINPESSQRPEDHPLTPEQEDRRLRRDNFLAELAIRRIRAKAGTPRRRLYR